MSQIDEAINTRDPLVILSSRLLRLTADPACGGKLRSLVSLRSGQEFFYQDRRVAFDGRKGYSFHDIGGWDECFPTVAACRGQAPSGDAYDYADHGLLWQEAWQAREAGGSLEMAAAVEPLSTSFHRRCAFEADDTLRLDYRIVNRGARPVPFVYSAHPLLAADEKTRVVLPAGMARAFNYLAADNFGLANGTWFDLPGPNPAGLTGPFRPERRTFAKLFSDRLAEGWCAVEYPDRDERLVMTFDVNALPHVGFLAQQGYDGLGDGYFAAEILLAFEPTTGVGDDVPTCLRTGTLDVLEPGADRRFWIRLTIERMSLAPAASRSGAWKTSE
jgi:galactose mutarotase-like enzyme